MDVEGVGAVVLGVPPVATVCQRSEFPEDGVAVNAVDAAPWQYEIAVVAVGWAGDRFTVSVTAVLLVLLQPEAVTTTSA